MKKAGVWLLLLLLLLCVRSRAACVEWTGLEWNGDTEGAPGERNCDIVSIGREPARTDSVPYGDPESAIAGAVNYDRSLSDSWLLLSQTEWRFSYYEDPASAASGKDAAFWQADFDDSDWDSIFVPSVWQTEGYDHPIYTNTTQKFARNFGNEGIGYPRDLPLAPTVYNPVGLYRRSFTLPETWDGQRVYLVFEGVDSAFYLWVNGIQVGYAEDSFTTDEFDITDYIRFGEENVIAVRVYRWCDGSWLEDQDYFDLSGIFRDVYCYTTPQTRVRDFSIITDFDSSFTDSTLLAELDIKNYEAASRTAQIRLQLYDAQGRPVPLENAQDTLEIPAGEEAAMTLAVKVAAPHKWSAEDPYLYTLVIEETTEAGTVYESLQLGFRKITYKTSDSGWFEGSTEDADLIRINGQPVSLRGVNRHETHPEYGYALTREVMEEDIRILLENNINAVRTSHYPNSPYWYYLCDKYGIYLVDEANLECHSNMIYENERITEYMTASVIDREYSMIRRDRNHPCVIMWSLGNECKNPEILRTILVQEYPDPEGTGRILHAYTADRPWHYEQAKTMTETGIDVYSGMYYHVEVLREWGESDAALPMIECEYEHAMGNSEGNFDEYWDAFDSYRNLQGGFIWDFVDQSIYAEAEDGTVYFGYGGDFGERIHDENFCANGLLLPDRTVQPEMAEVRYHYSQVKFEAEDLSAGTILMKNYFLFTDISEKYELHWKLLRDDTVLRDGILPADQLQVPCVDPLTNQPGIRQLQIPCVLTEADLKAGCEYFLELALCLKEEDRLLPALWCIAREQFALSPELPAPEGRSGGACAAVLTEGSSILVQTQTLQVRFDSDRGTLVSCEGLDAGGQWHELLTGNEGIRGDFVRASTDNDRAFGAGLQIFIDQWREPGEYLVSAFDLQYDGKTAVIRIEGSYPALNDLMLNMTYTVYGEGYLSCDAELLPNYNKNLVYLPVAGLTMTVSGELEQLTWFGCGPEETYIDRYKGTRVGRWETTVTDNYFPYLQSSETGNHIGTRWLTLTDASGFGLLLAAKGEPVEFSALHYTADELNRGVHPYELQALEDTILRVNAIQIGVGGDDSWARIVPHEQYLPHEAAYRYGFWLGVTDGTADAMAMARSWQTAG